MTVKAKKMKKLAIAADINPIGERLVGFTDALFDGQGVAFRLVHVNQPYRVPMLATGYIGEFSGVDLSGLIEGDVHHAAQKQLEQQSGDLLNRREVELAVLNGKPSEEISRDAFSSGSEIVVVSPGVEAKDSVPYGYSTTLNLMANSRVPVLAIPQELMVGGHKKPSEYKVLIADDFSESSRDALAYAKHFAGQFENSQIVHLHVAEDDEKSMKEFAEKLLEQMSLGKVPFKEGLSPESFVSDVKAGIEKQMLSRMDSTSGSDEISFDQYDQEVAFGDIPEQFKAMVEKHKPDLLVFGRHEGIHWKPFSIGKIPFHSMLSYNIPILLVPKELQQLKG